MFKNKRTSRISVLIILFLFVCLFFMTKELSADNNKVALSDKKTVAIQSTKDYIKMIPGSSFIKIYKVKEAKATIEYFSSYEEYIQLHPYSDITKEIYSHYFDEIENIAKEASTFVLKNDLSIDEVSLTIPGYQLKHEYNYVR